MEQAVREETVGQRLMEARCQRKLSIEDVAAEIMVPQHYLKSIEEDRFDALPGQTYAIGFVRNYSRYLNLSADEMVADLKVQVEFPKALDSFEIASGFVAPPRAKLLPGMGSIAAGLCVVAAVYGLWTVAGDTRSTAQLPAPLPGQAPLPTSSTPAMAMPAPVQQAQLDKPIGAPPLQAARVQTASAVSVIAQEQAPATVSVMDVKPSAPREAVKEMAPVETAAADAAPTQDVAIHVAEESWIEVRLGQKVWYTGIKQAGDTLMVPGPKAASASLTTGNAGGIWVSVGDWTSTAIGAPGRVRRNLELAPKNLLAVLKTAEPS